MKMEIKIIIILLLSLVLSRQVSIISNIRSTNQYYQASGTALKSQDLGHTHIAAKNVVDEYLITAFITADQTQIIVSIMNTISEQSDVISATGGSIVNLDLCFLDGYLYVVYAEKNALGNFIGQIQVYSIDSSSFVITSEGQFSFMETGNSNFQETSVSCQEYSNNYLYFSGTNNYDTYSSYEQRQVSWGALSPSETAFEYQQQNIVIGSGYQCDDGKAVFLENKDIGQVLLICAGRYQSDTNKSIFMFEIKTEEQSIETSNAITLQKDQFTEVKQMQTYSLDNSEFLILYNYNNGGNNIAELLHYTFSGAQLSFLKRENYYCNQFATQNKIILLLCTEDGPGSKTQYLNVINMDDFSTIEEIVVYSSDKMVTVSILNLEQMLALILYIDSFENLKHIEIELEFLYDDDEDQDNKDEDQDQDGDNQNQNENINQKQSDNSNSEESSKTSEYAAVVGVTLAGTAVLGGIGYGLQQVLSSRKKFSKVSNIQKPTNKLNQQNPQSAKQELLQTEVSINDEDLNSNQNSNEDIDNPQIMNQAEFDSQFEPFQKNNSPFNLIEKKYFNSKMNSQVDCLDLKSIDDSMYQTAIEEQQFSLLSSATAGALLINPVKSLEIPTVEGLSKYKNQFLAVFKSEERTLANNIDLNRRKGQRFKLKEIVQLIKDMTQMLHALEKNGKKGHGCMNPTNIYVTKNKLGITSGFKTKIVGNQIKRGLISRIIQFAKKKQQQFSQSLDEQLKVEPQNPQEASQYLSPEEYRKFFDEKTGYNPSVPEIKSDIFSLGLILYEILSFELVEELNQNESYKNKKVKKLKENINYILNLKQKSNSDKNSSLDDINKQCDNQIYSITNINEKKTGQELEAKNFLDQSPQQKSSSSHILSQKSESKTNQNLEKQILKINGQGDKNFMNSSINCLDSHKVSILENTKQSQIDEKNRKKIDDYKKILNLIECMLEYDKNKRINLEQIQLIVNKM